MFPIISAKQGSTKHRICHSFEFILKLSNNVEFFRSCSETVIFNWKISSSGCIIIDLAIISKDNVSNFSRVMKGVSIIIVIVIMISFSKRQDPKV